MQENKKLKLFFLGVILLELFVSGLALAQDLEIQYPTIPGAPSLEGGDLLPEYIKYLYNFSIIIAGLVAFFSFVYGGLRYILSVGQPLAMADAREQITAGIVGLIIILGSYLLLTTINPQLTVFRIGKPSVTEIVAECGNNRCEPGESPVNCEKDCPKIESTVTFTYMELPIGALIEEVLDENLLNEMKAITEEARKRSEVVKIKAEELAALLAQCSCGNTNPNASSCTYGAPCPATECTDDPCPNRSELEAKSAELKEVSQSLREWADGPLLNIYTVYRKKVRRLEIAKQLLEDSFYPINYDGFLELQDLAQDLIKEDIKVVPFIALGRVIKPKEDDPATFYISEREFELAGGVRLPPLEFDLLSSCDECEVPLHFADITIDPSMKETFANEYPGSGITASCPGGLDCWDYAIQQAKANGWNPAFLLGIWAAESSFSSDSVALGCDIWKIKEGTSSYNGGIVSQLECFFDTVAPATGNCRDGNQCSSGNTDFCAFARCWTSGPGKCTLYDDPYWFPNVFETYTRLIPPQSPAAPSGNCTLSPGPLPPGLAGCPLQPGFTVNCGWHGYHREDCYWHDGIDLSASVGDPVYAVADGNIRTGYGDGIGNYIDLDIGLGFFRYGHLSQTIGDGPVKKGTLIGLAGATGENVTGPHLHLSFHQGGVNAQPIECLNIQCINEAEDRSGEEGCTPFPGCL